MARLVGNGSRPLVQRKTAPAAAAASGDPDQVSDVDAGDWASATNEDRRKAVFAMLSKSFMFPWNDTTVRTILNSYPDRDTMSDGDIAAVKAAVARGSVKGGELKGYLTVSRDFEHVVIKQAHANVVTNLGELEEMAKKYGLGGQEAEGGASGIPSAMEELQMAAGRVADARHVQRTLRKIKVGYKPAEGSGGLLPSSEAFSFDPAAAPVSMGAIQMGPDMVEWSKVKSVYDQLDVAIGTIMSANPALYLLAATPALDQRLLNDDDRLNFGKTALADFETAPDISAHKELEHSYTEMKTKLTTVKAKLEEDPPGIDAVSLDAVGLRVASTPRFDSPFAQWATHNYVEVNKDTKEQISTFLNFAAAVLLIGATIGTMGGAAAAAAVLAGGATAATVASAGVTVANAADLNLTAGTGIRPEDRLTSQAKASWADLDATLAVAAALLAAIPALKFLLFRRASSVAEDLIKLEKLSEGRAARGGDSEHKGGRSRANGSDRRLRRRRLPVAQVPRPRLRRGADGARHGRRLPPTGGGCRRGCAQLQGTAGDPDLQQLGGLARHLHVARRAPGRGWLCRQGHQHGPLRAHRRAAGGGAVGVHRHHRDASHARPGRGSGPLGRCRWLRVRDRGGRGVGHEQGLGSQPGHLNRWSPAPRRARGCRAGERALGSRARLAPGAVRAAGAPAKGRPVRGQG